MAYRDDSIKWSEGEGAVIFAEGYFNVDLAVGGPEVGSNLPAANRVADMQLVNYMDFVIYRDGDRSIFPITANDKFSVTPPEFDYNSEAVKKSMAGMIWRFQGHLRQRGKPVFQDGRCDAARGKFSSLQKSPYTILMYNFYYASTVEKAYGRTDWQTYLMQDKLLPEQCRSEILIRQLAYTYM